jgi:hypothetical protein
MACATAAAPVAVASALTAIVPALVMSAMADAACALAPMPKFRIAWATADVSATATAPTPTLMESLLTIEASAVSAPNALLVIPTVRTLWPIALALVDEASADKLTSMTPSLVIFAVTASPSVPIWKMPAKLTACAIPAPAPAFASAAKLTDMVASAPLLMDRPMFSAAPPFPKPD